MAECIHPPLKGKAEKQGNSACGGLGQVSLDPGINPPILTG
jgi:hypothetical protein